MKIPLIFTLMLAGHLPAATTPEQIEFFESKIRPILAQECYECHAEATKQKGGLLLDSRPGWQAGGDSGDVIKPGNPADSLLVQTLKHQHEDLKMPKNGAKLEDSVIADFAKWIADGAADPRDTPPSKESLAKETDWKAVLERRKQWWAFQPVKPQPAGRSIDHYLNEALTKAGITPAPRADEATLRRRASYVITGLAPQASETHYEAYVDTLLASPQYGEKWARHFMDWVRYAETYGSEGDPVIPYAWRYRDYLIRAFNHDVPWQQLVKEAIAGDLLPQPRMASGLNESAIGIGQQRMVLHGFTPVDSLDEMVTFTDNQIDTVTKAFQGLTVSCARCHNHKFDAISQTDFYALYGIFTSTHPAVIDVNATTSGENICKELLAIKQQIKEAMIQHWDLADAAPVSKTDGASGLSKLQWFEQGLSLSKAGEFSVALEGDQVIARIYPSGYHSDLLSNKTRAVLYSNRFINGGGTLWFRAAGGGGVKGKYVVQNYPRTGTIHKAIVFKEPPEARLAWRSLDLEFWKDDELFIQIATAADAPAELGEERSWFSLNDVQITKDKTPPTEPKPSTATPSQLVTAWKTNRLGDADSEALNTLVQSGKLPNKSVQNIAPLVTRYRQLEASLPTPTRVPGVVEADAKDAALFIRGDHKQPSELVPRRFLDALDPTPFKTQQSGRLELAEHLADLKNNPLTARVIVNRLWHHVFGRGIVSSTDNFGKLGDPPTHPELLDFLAQRLVLYKGSLKAVLREILVSDAFQREAGSHPADPDNKLLGHWRIRRLEAEAIRDSIVALSGKLDPTLYGEPVSGATPRRSTYVRVVRNALDPFLTTFDSPVPFSTRGNRDTTNVPAQSLTLLNDANVIGWASDWAAKSDGASPRERITQMFREALGRDPSSKELEQATHYLTALQEEMAQEIASKEAAAAKLNVVDGQLQALLQPARAALLAQRKLPPTPEGAPKPMLEWTFDKDLLDSTGNFPLTTIGNAKVEHGALVVDGQSAAKTSALPKNLKAKTIEAWVQLDTLDQQGGGVLTVQDSRGDVFDSIVFGEKRAKHWVAGSDRFNRSELFEGESESEATNRVVHFAVVYQADGTITGYRDGKPHGKTYRKAAAAEFEAAEGQILFGCRHGSPGGNRGLRGRIYRGRVYDRALTAAEIAVAARVEASSVTEAEVFASLKPEVQSQVTALRNQRIALHQKQKSSENQISSGSPEQQSWASMAQAIINLKEFIYLK